MELKWDLQLTEAKVIAQTILTLLRFDSLVLTDWKGDDQHHHQMMMSKCNYCCWNCCYHFLPIVTSSLP